MREGEDLSAEKGLRSITVLPQLFYLLTLSFWRHTYILSHCLWTLTINIFPLKSFIELDLTKALPLAKGEALFLFNDGKKKKGSLNK